MGQGHVDDKNFFPIQLTGLATMVIYENKFLSAFSSISFSVDVFDLTVLFANISNFIFRIVSKKVLDRPSHNLSFAKSW